LSCIWRNANGALTIVK